MSETDDTDVLLLIPPNFFLIQSSESEDSLLESSRTVVHKPTSCTAKVLDKLVTQVHSLETRLESLEISTDISSIGKKAKYNSYGSTDSLGSHSLDRKSFTFPRRRRRKTQRKEKSGLSLTSFDSVSTITEYIPRLKLNEKLPGQHTQPEIINDTRSMDGDISSIVSTPSKKNDKLLLNEIDEFLTKVESYESPDSKLKNRECDLTPENIIKATGDYLTQQLEPKYEEDQIKLPSGRVVSSSMLDKYIYLVKSNPSSQSETSVPTARYKTECDSIQSTSTQQFNNKTENVTKTNMKDQETRSPRRLNFIEKDVQPTSTPKKSAESYLDRFKPTSNKIYDRATKVLEQYKAQTSQSTADSYMQSLQREDFKLPQMRPYSLDHKEGIRMTAMQNKLIDSIDTDLLSLSELWGERGERERVERIDSVKLEEERLKREHCEAMIQQLQKKLLDQQEKLAVAVKVDRSKDAAIAKLKEAWGKITGSLERAEERHRAALDNMVREVDNFKKVADEAQKKTNHFEAELYKALDLAHDYQEKYKQLTLQKKELQDNMERAITAKQEIVDNKDKELEMLRQNYETVMTLNKQSTDCVKNLEEALEKEKSEHNQTKQQSIELTNQIQSLVDNEQLLSQQSDVLKHKVNEERARCSMMEQQLADMQNQCSELLRKCDNRDAEVKSLHKMLELQKNELKSHYQRQLEDAVMAKLTEFQRQLDANERDLERDARAKEAALIDNFNKQITRIEEQHKLEVKVMEEKQREEIKLYRLQLAQAGENIELLQSKLSSLKSRRGELAAQLHAVMEAQWRQTLGILTRPHHAISAPAPLAVPAQSLTSHGRETLTSHGRDTLTSLARETLTSHDRDKALTSLAHDTLLTSQGRDTLTSQGRDTLTSQGRDTPLNFEALSNTELNHYIKMLLTMPPGLLGGGDSHDKGRLDLGSQDKGKSDFGSHVSRSDLGSHTSKSDMGKFDLGSHDKGRLDLGRLDLGSQDKGRLDLGSHDKGRLDLGSHMGSVDTSPGVEEPTSDLPDRRDKTARRNLNCSKPPWKS